MILFGLELWIWVVILAAVGMVIVLANIYVVVPPDYADVVSRDENVKVYSPYKEYSADGKSAYFNIPEWFFLFKLGMQVKRIPLKILAINVPNFLAFDKDRARFVCDIVTYVVVKDPIEAAKRFGGDLTALTSQISVIVQSTTRDITTKKAIREVINNRQDIIDAITPTLSQSIKSWGLELKSLELIDFKDPDFKTFGVESHVISDISSIIEQQINSEARQKNAEQKKEARTKEAAAEEEARKREIFKDEVVAKREQEKDKNVAISQKEAVEKELEVTRIREVTTQEINKAKMIVEANQRKEIEQINKEQKQLEGEGDKLRLQEQARGNAAKILEDLKAEAEGKTQLQEALNKFGDTAIRALVAEKIVEMQKDVGVAGAKALENAEIKVFSGGSDGDKAAFDVGKSLEALFVSNEGSLKSVLNRLSRPNDLGFNLTLNKDGDKQEKIWEMDPVTGVPVARYQAQAQQYPSPKVDDKKGGK